MLKYLMIALSLTLSGCAWFGFGTSTSGHSGKVRLPKVPPTQIPGGNTKSWHYLGTTTNGNLIAEIDSNNIASTTKANIYTFHDRKTVVDPNKFEYSDQIHYKYILSTWTMDCNSKAYLLNNSSVYDQYGALLKEYNYGDDSSVKWLQFGDDSIADLQYQFVCIGKDRNLGY